MKTVKINKNTVLVGMDPHKYTHSAVFLNFLGNELDSFEFSTTQIDKLTNKIKSLPKNKQAQEELKSTLNKLQHNSHKAKLALLKLEELLVLKEKLQALDAQIAELSKDIDEVQRFKDTIYGCGTLTAANIVAEVQDVSRFKDESHFASYAIVAPKERSSAFKTKMLTNKMGNKRLNKALHFIALSQITKENTKGRQYHNKKLKSGKAKLSSLRSLKRYIARKVYRTLKSS